MEVTFNANARHARAAILFMQDFIQGSFIYFRIWPLEIDVDALGSIQFVFNSLISQGNFSVVRYVT